VYELLGGLVSIAGGIYGYLAAVGKIKISKSEEKSVDWRAKYGKFLKVICPLLVMFGVFRVMQLLLN
jgi:hypothetical protein